MALLVSKERATRREQRESDKRAATAARQRKSTRRQRRQQITRAVTAPFRWVAATVARVATAFGRRTRGQRIVLGLTALLVLGGLALATTWATRIVVVGMAVLLLPVAWTLASPRRR